MKLFLLGLLALLSAALIVSASPPYVQYVPVQYISTGAGGFGGFGGGSAGGFDGGMEGFGGLFSMLIFCKLLFKICCCTDQLSLYIEYHCFLFSWLCSLLVSGWGS